MFNIRPELDVVEVFLINFIRYARATAIPSHFYLWMLSMYELCECLHVFWFGVATHKTNASDFVFAFFRHFVKACDGEWLPDVVPKVLAMATGAVAWAVCYVD